MIPVQEAIEKSLEVTEVLSTVEVPLTEAPGRVISQDVVSDIDMPPFDKSSMDGYALRHADTESAPTELKIAGFIPAGAYPDFILQAGEAAKIMTGAPVPEGADSIQMVEKTALVDDSTVRIIESVQHGQHIARKGEVIQAGDLVLPKGTLLSPAMIGLLATVGAGAVSIYRQANVAILVTGDELVEVNETPQKGQIRNSNGYALFSQVAESGAKPFPLGIAPDDIDTLRAKIEHGLQCDMLLISGGVSMGDLDLVEDVFASLGVRVLYDKVNIKPGKPTVCGKYKDTVVFGLPGNPVSASTIFEVVVLPCLRKMMGYAHLHHVQLPARAMAGLKSKTRRCYYAPAWSFYNDGEVCTTPIFSKGSADVLAFGLSNSYIVVPGHTGQVSPGESVQVMLRNEFWRTCHQAHPALSR